MNSRRSRWPLFSLCFPARWSSLRYPISSLPPCPLLWIPNFTLRLITNWQCTATSLLGSCMVRDKRLAVTRPIYKPFCLAYDHRCLYHNIRYLGLRPPVSCPLGCPFEGKDDTHWVTNIRWPSGASQVSLPLRLECACLESQLSHSPWESLHWCWRQH